MMQGRMMSHGQARQEYCERFMACRDWSSAFIVINPCATPMHLPFQAFDRKASKSVKVASGGAGPAAAQLCWFVGCGLMVYVGSQVFAWRIGVYRPCSQPTATNGREEVQRTPNLHGKQLHECKRTLLPRRMFGLQSPAQLNDPDITLSAQLPSSASKRA